MTSKFFNKLTLLKDRWFFSTLKMKLHLLENIHSPHLQVCCIVIATSLFPLQRKEIIHFGSILQPTKYLNTLFKKILFLIIILGDYIIKVLFISLIYKCLLGAYSVLSTILGPRDTRAKQSRSSCSLGVYIPSSSPFTRETTEPYLDRESVICPHGSVCEQEGCGFGYGLKCQFRSFSPSICPLSVSSSLFSLKLSLYVLLTPALNCGMQLCRVGGPSYNPEWLLRQSFCFSLLKHR